MLNVRLSSPQRSSLLPTAQVRSTLIAAPLVRIENPRVVYWSLHLKLDIRRLHYAPVNWRIHIKYKIGPGI